MGYNLSPSRFVKTSIIFAACLFFFSPAPAQPSPTSPGYRQALSEELIYRVNFGRADDVRILLARGANPDAVNAEGWPAVAIAADRTDPEGFKILQALTEGGADINAADKTGSYALINAARNGSLEAVRYLIGKGADIGVRDASGRTAMSIAKSAGNREITAAIQQKLDEEAARKAALASPENFIRLAEQYAHSACLYQYYGYYMASGQDPGNNDKSRSKMKEMREKMNTSYTELRTLFPATPERYLPDISGGVAKTISSQLDGFVSNRNRRAHGVGKEQDGEKRCTLIVQALRITPPPSRKP